MSSFPSRLTILMKEFSCTQQQLAEVLMVKRQTIGKYANSIAEPNLDTLSKIADFFNCSVDYLLGRADDLGTIAISPSPALELTTEERELVDTFRRMTPNLQKIAIDTLHSFAGDRETQRSDGSIATRKA